MSTGGTSVPLDYAAVTKNRPQMGILNLFWEAQHGVNNMVLVTSAEKHALAWIADQNIEKEYTKLSSFVG